MAMLNNQRVIPLFMRPITHSQVHCVMSSFWKTCSHFVASAVRTSPHPSSANEPFKESSKLRTKFLHCFFFLLIPFWIISFVHPCNCSLFHFIFVQLSIHPFIQYTFTYTNTVSQTYTYTSTYTYIHIYIHIHIQYHIHIHIHIRIQIHIHIYIWSLTV